MPHQSASGVCLLPTDLMTAHVYILTMRRLRILVQSLFVLRLRLWNSNHGADKVEAACRKTLK
eukprot:5618823-Pyramimonas_sp.AAC.1